MSLHPSLRNFGERPGDRVSAEWVSRIQDEVTAARSISAAPPLVIEDGIGGPILWLDPTTITLRRVVLDEELVGGWYAAGAFLLYDAAAKTMTLRGEPVTVYDSAHDAGVVVATSGATVYVSWHEDSGRWEVVTSQPSAGDFFPASIAARRRVGSSTKVWQYTCERLEFDTMADLPSEPSDSALGEFNTVEINNRRVPLGTIVWLKHVFGDSPTLSFEVTTAGNEADVSTAFELFLDDVSSGTFTLTVDGDETSAIASDATAADIKTELESATGLTFTTFSGSGTRAEPWTFSETGSYASRTVDSDASDLTGTKTYAFEYDGEKYFPAKITSSELVDGVPSHSWVEMCATGPNVPLIVKSGGRSGTKATATGAVGYNGRRVNDGTIVNMTSADDEGDGDGTVTITRTQNGNGSDTPTIWEVVINASEGTYTLAMDGGTETSELDYTAGTSAVDAAIEAASGETVSITGTGLPGDPWIITVTSDFASHTLAVVTNNLVGAAYVFDDSAYSGYYWTDIKTSDYQASVWEAIPVQPNVYWSGSISGATNATPIVITTTLPHYLYTGDTVTIASVGGNTAANGTWTITRINATSFSLDGSVGSGAYTSGGTFTANHAPTITLPDWSAAAVNDRVLVNVLSDTTPGRLVLWEPSGSDKVNGKSGGGNFGDPATSYLDYGTWFGRYIEFIRTPHSDVGWACSAATDT